MGSSVETTIRCGGGAVDSSNAMSSSGCGGGVVILRRTTVISPGSSSSTSGRFSLGIATKFGSSSDTRGVPSLVQNRMISSSYRVLHFGQYFIFCGLDVGDQ